MASGELHRVFRERVDSVSSNDHPLIGLFGEGIPRAIIAASGAMPLDVKAPPLSDNSDGPIVAAVSAIAENFLDDFTARFLHRLAAGAFQKFELIVFSRDDVAALTAYQYAQELRRSGVLASHGPRFHLWNFLHTDSDAVAQFNKIELDRLTQVLAEVTGSEITDLALTRATGAEATRSAILDQYTVHNAESFVYRNAGRWLPPARHVDLLQALPTTPAPQRDRRIGIVGTACDLVVLHDICADFGTVTADLQPYGQVWPTPFSGTTNSVDMLRELARSPFHIRTSPPGRYTDALVEALSDCDLVVSSVDRNDDSFGWDLPVLRLRLAPNGITVVDLGFRPFRPDADWIENARETIREALR